MVLNSTDRSSAVRFLVALFVIGSLTLAGCGSSEETMMEEEGFEEQVAEEPAAEESADDQALTSFIGAAPKKEEAQPESTPAQEQPAVPPSSMDPMEELRTENTSLKQKIVKLEQDARTLTARVTDAEAKYLAEKDRADRAEEAARAAAASAVIAARSGPVSQADMTAYEEALRTFNSKQYDVAIEKFHGLLSSGVSPDWEDNCHYWLGESNFGKKNFTEAAAHFEKVLEYPKSEKLADAHFMLGKCYERTGQKAKAKAAYEKVVKDFPMSNNVGRAKQRWAKL